MNCQLKIVLIGALVLLSACRSDPIRFHTLTPLQKDQTAQLNDVEVKIERIKVPPQVDRSQIVIRQGNSSLAILETEWWGSSLVDELTSALKEQLSNSNSHGGLSLRLDFQRFDSVPGQYALIDVKWRLRSLGAEGKVIASCRSSIQTPADATIDDIVIAHQHNLQRLSADIIQVIGNEARPCP